VYDFPCVSVKKKKGGGEGTNNKLIKLHNCYVLTFLIKLKLPHAKNIITTYFNLICKESSSRMKQPKKIFFTHYFFPRVQLDHFIIFIWFQIGSVIQKKKKFLLFDNINTLLYFCHFRNSDSIPIPYLTNPILP
jgi:hypothetical protein